MTDVELTVRGPKVLVQVDAPTETVTPSGIIAVESHNPGVIGTVVAAGTVREVKAGDIVLFPPEAGQPLDWQAHTYLVLDEDELIAIWDAEHDPI